MFVKNIFLLPTILARFLYSIYSHLLIGSSRFSTKTLNLRFLFIMDQQSSGLHQSALTRFIIYNLVMDIEIYKHKLSIAHDKKSKINNFNIYSISSISVIKKLVSSCTCKVSHALSSNALSLSSFIMILFPPCLL